jgi:hypothetical protein
MSIERIFAAIGVFASCYVFVKVITDIFEKGGE